MKKHGTVCFIVEDESVLLVRISYPDGQVLWNGIGGVVDAGESATQAVIREVTEETEISVLKSDLTEEMIVDVGEYDLHVFVATKWSGELEAIDPTLGELKWFKLADVPYGEMHKDNDKWLPQILSKYL